MTNIEPSCLDFISFRVVRLAVNSFITGKLSETFKMIKKYLHVAEKANMI